MHSASTAPKKHDVKPNKLPCEHPIYWRAEKIPWKSPFFFTLVDAWLDTPGNLELALTPTPHTLEGSEAVEHAPAIMLEELFYPRSLVFLRTPQTVLVANERKRLMEMPIAEFASDFVEAVLPRIVAACDRRLTQTIHCGVTLVSEDGQQLWGMWSGMLREEDRNKCWRVASWGGQERGNDRIGPFATGLQKSLTLKFSSSKVNCSTELYITPLEILLKDKGVEERLGYTHEALSKRRDISPIYRHGTVARRNVRRVLEGFTGRRDYEITRYHWIKEFSFKPVGYRQMLGKPCY